MKRNYEAENRKLRAKLKLEVARRKFAEKRLDAEVLARDRLEEDLRLHKAAEVAKAARSSWGRPTEVYRNGRG
jgi:hypothetical protein